MWLTQWPIWRPADMEEYNVADMVDDMVANKVFDAKCTQLQCLLSFARLFSPKIQNFQKNIHQK